MASTPEEINIRVNVDLPPVTTGAFIDYAALSYEIMDELRRAHAKFPDQHLSWGGNPNATHVAMGRREYIRDLVRARVDEALREGTATWADVIAEEFWEAVSEIHLPSARGELIQLAAMCYRAVADIDAELHRRANAHVHLDARPSLAENHFQAPSVPRGPSRPGDLGYKGQHPLDKLPPKWSEAEAAGRVPRGSCGDPNCQHAPDGGPHPIEGTGEPK